MGGEWEYKGKLCVILVLLVGIMWDTEEDKE